MGHEDTIRAWGRAAGATPEEIESALDGVAQSEREACALACEAEGLAFLGSSTRGTRKLGYNIAMMAAECAATIRERTPEPARRRRKSPDAVSAEARIAILEARVAELERAR